MLYSHLHHHSASQRHNIKDRRMKENAGILLFKYIYLSLYYKGSKGLFKGLHVRGCWRPNVNFIFWPHCYDRHVVSFSWCWGPLHRGFPKASSVGCGFSYHISSLAVWKSADNCFGGFPSAPSVGCSFPYHIWSLAVWKSADNCFGGFPSAPSVGCGLPYHIWSLLSGIRLATASGVSEVPLGRVWPSLPHLVSNSLGVCWQLHWGVSECPLGRVWPSLPHLVSTVWNSAGNCSGTQTQLS